MRGSPASTGASEPASRPLELIAYDILYAEGSRMMSVGLHCRLAGRPGRAAAVARILDYVAGHEDVWIARRIDIAQHWREKHPADES